MSLDRRNLRRGGNVHGKAEMVNPISKQRNIQNGLLIMHDITSRVFRHIHLFGHPALRCTNANTNSTSDIVQYTTTREVLVTRDITPRHG